MNIKFQDKENDMLITDRYVFFYRNSSPFSNFYQPCTFSYSFENETPNVFFSSEQAFMWHKARVFKDEETARKILDEGKSSPRFCKDQGRLVKNYDDSVWNSLRENVMKSVNIAKFSQNSDLKEFILDPIFENKTFVEASPWDKIWGIGMSVKDKGVEDPKNWKGTNLLGCVLTKVRKILKETVDNTQNV